jgi:serine/threonine-protein kinase SRPK3
MWSLATMIFELVTGDYLFDPCKGKTFKKNDDHLGQISELIGECNDKKWLETCDGHEDFYTNRCKLKRISKLKLWPLKNVLLEKYRMKESEASSLASFLGAMLKWNPNHRASAKEMLEHQWLKMAPKYNTYMPKDEAREWKKLHRPDEASSSSSSEHD